MTLSQPRLELVGVSKTFGQNRVLSGIDLTVEPGEIHGLAGQNGSGKSTLIKILTGVHAPDAGAVIQLDGTPLGLPVRWREAHAAGITVVHQDLGLLDHLTVSENVCVGGFPTKLGRIDRRARDAKTSATLDRLGAEVSPHTLVGELSAAERAEVALARALRDHDPGEGLMILDESTRALRGADLERVHSLLRKVSAEGSSIVLISHSLPELAALADRVTVLRDGAVAGRLGGAGDPITETSIARSMLGSALVSFLRDRSDSEDRAEKPPHVVIRDLRGHRLAPLDLTLHPGEIVGVTGVPGSGFEDLPELLTGGRRPLTGSVEVGGRTLDLTRSSVFRAMQSGIALVPERRGRDGLALELSVRDNITLPQVRSRPWTYLSRAWQTRQAQTSIDDLGVRPSAPQMLVRELSGGNQQKVLLAKWMAMRPSLLVLHEPTQAVDVGARRDILQRVCSAAKTGTSVLIVSSEADDLTAVCHRVLIHTPSGWVAGSSTDSATLLRHIFSPSVRSTP